MRYAIIAVLICASLQSTVAAELQPRLATPVRGARHRHANTLSAGDAKYAAAGR